MSRPAERSLLSRTSWRPETGLPLHTHAREGESWYVLEGNLRFKLDGEILRAAAGSFVFVPAGAPHCFQNDGDVPARILESRGYGGVLRPLRGAAARPRRA